MFTENEIRNFKTTKKDISLYLAKRNDEWKDVIFLGPMIDKGCLGIEDTTASFLCLVPYRTQFVSIVEQYKNFGNVLPEQIPDATLKSLASGWIDKVIDDYPSSRILTRQLNSKIYLLYLDGFNDAILRMAGDDDYIDVVEKFIGLKHTPTFITNKVLTINRPYFDETKIRYMKK